MAHQPPKRHAIARFGVIDWIVIAAIVDRIASTPFFLQSTGKSNTGIRQSKHRNARRLGFAQFWPALTPLLPAGREMNLSSDMT
jgi:hypothetical protein